MLPRFFTKNVTRDVWLKTTRDMTYKQRASFFQNHLATALVWDQALAYTAQLVAQTCVYQHNMYVAA